MTINQLILPLTNSMYISMSYEPFLKQYGSTPYDTAIYWHDHETKTLFGVYIEWYFLEDLIGSLKLAINNESPLHKSITTDLGYDWNRLVRLSNLDERHKEFFYIPAKDGKSANSWVGLQYYLCDTPGTPVKDHVTTWMYNDTDGNIVLLVTPFYRWSMQEFDPEENIPFIEFDEFMKNYKPLVKAIIPKDVAKQWIMLCQHRLDLLTENTNEIN